MDLQGLNVTEIQTEVKWPLIFVESFGENVQGNLGNHIYLLTLSFIS